MLLPSLSPGRVIAAGTFSGGADFSSVLAFSARRGPTHAAENPLARSGNMHHEAIADAHEWKPVGLIHPPSHCAGIAVDLARQRLKVEKVIKEIGHLGHCLACSVTVPLNLRTTCAVSSRKRHPRKCRIRINDT